MVKCLVSCHIVTGHQALSPVGLKHGSVVPTPKGNEEEMPDGI